MPLSTLRLLSLLPLLGVAAALPARAAAPSPTPLQTLVQYDARAPLQLEEVGSEVRDQARVRDIRFRGGTRKGDPNPVRAYLVTPLKEEGAHPALLYVHWYGEPEPSDRRQFLEEAVRMARYGVVSLLVDAMWAEHGWFDRRTHAGDFEASVRQVVALRRALDVLLAQPGVDPRRVGYVGHDFGAMYGVLLGAADGRLSTLVLLAGTPRFSEWYLLGKRKPADLKAYLAQMEPLDPVRHVGTLGVPVFFQFARKDPYVPEARAREFLAAAREPRSASFYDAGHALSVKDGVADRFLWLSKQLRLAR